MKRSITFLLFLAPIILALALYAVFQMTDPAVIGPGGVLGVFVLIYLECLSVLFILLRFGVRWIGAVALRGKDELAQASFSIGEKKAYYVASVLALSPVALLAMHAFSQLQWTDVALVVFLMTIATFYIVKRN